MEVTVNRPRTTNTHPAPQPAPAPRGTSGSARRDLLVPAALAYAARGWHVFPLRPGDKRPAFPDHSADRCTGTDPRCGRAARHVTWEERATTDPARIRAAWTSAPFGIGIATGPSGLLVIDLDQPKPGGAAHRPADWDEPGITDGADVFAAMCSRHGHETPLDTYTVTTGSGGTHLYFTAPTGDGAPQLRCTAGHLGWLIDTRAHGGYVVAPPSTVAGRAYVADDESAEAAPLPAWLATGLTPAPLPTQEPTPIRLRAGNSGGVGGDERLRAYLESAINGAVAAVHAAGGGQRNRAVYGAAVQLGQLVAGGALDEATVTGALLPAAIAVGQRETEAVRTIASGMRKGSERPRYVPQAGQSTGAAA
nr:bifunctional DNA primase/polymerase [Kineosporia babensis]